MFDEILKVANLYSTGLDAVNRRREQWLEKYESLRDHLTAISEYLNEHAEYKQGFFVDTLHAFNKDIKGTSSRMPSLAFRSGSMPMLVTFRNTMGEKKAYSEEGFKISFTPVITGQIIVLVKPHDSDIDEDKAEYITLAIIDEPGLLTNEIADELIQRGMEIAFYSSFTGMGQAPTEEPEIEKKPRNRNPIGFKRYDTTEKIK